ncbi:MAG: thioredoxin [Alphaproteobacteria bacterium]|jgi:putative thioredoxin|nr:thioredoxin [Alphaproteobacteria bacterium]MDP6516071.1 thioredoxin [Alphaproteobacteria bacterium]
MEPIIGAGGGAPATDLVKDGDTRSFAVDVIEASKQVPVIVDFWAPWCEPCKQLGPAIERAVVAAGGAVKLVKVNIDQNQELAAQLQIQSIPAVFAFKDGRPVDGFVGALPDSQIKSFIERLGGDGGPSPVAQALGHASQAAAGGDHANAEAVYRQVLDHEPGNTAAIAGIARCRLAAGDLAGARAALESAPGGAGEDTDIAGARAALELAEEAAEGGGDGADLAGLRQRLDAKDDDHQARYDLAMALFGSGQREAAIDEMLEIVRRARSWNDEAARKQLVKFFEAMGPTDALTVDARGRLSTLLFS